MNGYNQRTGKHGERLAQDFLLKTGYHIVAVNYRCRCGEIDLIASKGEIFAFVEVKTRSQHRYGLPREAVTPTKQRAIIRTAQQYIQRYKLYKQMFRFDVIEVYDDKQPAEIIHIENAFSL